MVECEPNQIINYLGGEQPPGLEVGKGALLAPAREPVGQHLAQPQLLGRQVLCRSGWRWGVGEPCHQFPVQSIHASIDRSIHKRTRKARSMGMVSKASEDSSTSLLPPPIGRPCCCCCPRFRFLPCCPSKSITSSSSCSSSSSLLAALAAVLPPPSPSPSASALASTSIPGLEWDEKGNGMSLC